ncbi:MAG TPA: magnesium transporter, partial [Spirochaetes bacterium]|nr:magnesium transporter [Spirochaetota bacterium]
EEYLVGRITFDDVMDVIEEEAAEDISKMAGVSDEILTGETSSMRISRIRLPWLLIGLLGGILAAMLISFYGSGSTINKKDIIILGFFTPVIMSMGGNIGIQSSTIVVRGLATGEIGFAYKHLFKEIKIALLNGFICSLIFSMIASLWQELEYGYLLGVSLFLVMVIAATVGTLVPLALKKFNIDPAIATGPFITISNDLIGLAIYFTIATLMFGK